MLPRILSIWQRDSQPNASGRPGAVHFSIAGRAEYIASSGGDCGVAADCAPTNLFYGPKSRAWSLTVTPTYQRGIFFARTELSYTRIDRVTEGYGFGSNFDKRDQVRGMFEAGVLF